jgi:hypothetical protein
MTASAARSAGRSRVSMAKSAASPSTRPWPAACSTGTPSACASASSARAPKAAAIPRTSCRAISPRSAICAPPGRGATACTARDRQTGPRSPSRTPACPPPPRPGGRRYGTAERRSTPSASPRRWQSRRRDRAACARATTSSPAVTAIFGATSRTPASIPPASLPWPRTASSAACPRCPTARAAACALSTATPCAPSRWSSPRR